MRSLMNLSIPPRGGSTKVGKPVEFYRLLEVPHTVVIEELVALAAKHAGITARYDREDRHAKFGDVMITEKSEDKIFKFSNELRRLRDAVKNPLNEPIMNDDDPVHQGYVYVADGKVRMFIDGADMTVRKWKALPGHLGVSEVRRCDTIGRQLRTPDQDQKNVTPAAPAHRWDSAGRTIRQAKRRSRSSNKIKKVISN